MEDVIQGVRAQWNFANMITAGRALSVVVALPLLFFGLELELFALVVAAVISDAEGYLARFTNTTTPFGGVFDPLADKFFTNTMILMAAVAHMEASLFLLLCVNVTYDVDNTSRRLRDIVEACRNRSIVATTTPVTWLSKTKTCVLFLLVIVLYVPSSMAVPEEKFIPVLAIAGTMFVLMCWWHNRKETIRKWLR
jgi:phosphatidylglycerophosphate synthase